MLGLQAWGTPTAGVGGLEKHANKASMYSLYNAQQAEHCFFGHCIYKYYVRRYYAWILKQNEPLVILMGNIWL